MADLSFNATFGIGDVAPTGEIGGAIPVITSPTPAGRRVRFKAAIGAAPTRAASGDFLPYGEAADPLDFTDYCADFDDLLAEGEVIVSATLTLTPEAALWGMILGDGDYAALVSDDRTAIRYFIGVTPQRQTDARFANDGVRAGVEISVVTSHNPPRVIQRTAVLIVRQR